MVKRTRSKTPDLLGGAAALPESPHKSKKLKLHAAYAVDSPFPTWPLPTPEEAREVHALLSKENPTKFATRNPARAEGNSANSCGHVPNVLDALIGVILSQNTSGRNSSGAKATLDAKFGKHNFAAIATAPKEDVVDALRQGGLANRKATIIQKILSEVKDKHGEYSLQHLAETKDGQRFTDDEIMKELMSYDGVGPKTASCVLLFCLGRESFAVDTHVFRLSKVLDWVPPKADRVLAQAHLDLRISEGLKYGLHVLMIQHGRICKGCKKPGSKFPCVLKTYVKERKAASGSKSKNEQMKDDPYYIGGSPESG